MREGRRLDSDCSLQIVYLSMGHSGQRLGSIAEWGSLANGVQGLILLEEIMVSAWVHVGDF